VYGEEIGVVGLDIPASRICVMTDRFTHRDIKPHILSVDQDLVERREALDGVPSDLSDLSTKFPPRSERDVIRNGIHFGYNVPRLCGKSGNQAVWYSKGRSPARSIHCKPFFAMTSLLRSDDLYTVRI